MDSVVVRVLRRMAAALVAGLHDAVWGFVWLTAAVTLAVVLSADPAAASGVDIVAGATAALLVYVCGRWLYLAAWRVLDRFLAWVSAS